jgi:hypothetical protein
VEVKAKNPIRLINHRNGTWVACTYATSQSFDASHTTEGLLGRNSSGFGLEVREYGRGEPSR